MSLLRLHTLSIVASCITIFLSAKEASTLYIQLTREALQRYGHKDVASILITNHPGARVTGTCINTVDGKQLLGINFDEQGFLATAPYGVKRMTAYHEAWHIVAGHTIS